MTSRLKQLYGLKWNPFSADVPVEGLFPSPRLENFAWRVEQLARDGGFAAVFGEPGTGKSVALRLVRERLERLRDVVVGVVTRPQARVTDFYRELGHLFRVPLRPHNRWAGAKALRDAWLGHIDTSMCRPIVVFDEAQEADPVVLNELRLLASADLDARAILTVVFAGDSRFVHKLRQPDLVPLDSRLRVRLVLESAGREELQAMLTHCLDKAGAPRLMTPQLHNVLVEHAAGNCRSLMMLANELLHAAAHHDQRQLDEKLFLDMFSPPANAPQAGRAKRTTAGGAR